MTYSDIIKDYKQSLTDKTQIIKTEMNLFYNNCIDSTNFVSDYDKFVETFENKIAFYGAKYSMSSPEILLDTIYKNQCFFQTLLR